MMKALVTLLSVTALCGFASPMMAQDMPAELPNFADMDTNTDGYLNQAELEVAKEGLEAAGVTSATLDQVDQNDDDLISRIEYQDLVNALQQSQEAQEAQGG